MGIDSSYKHSELTDLVIGVFYDVYNELGFGFLESVYRNSLRHALIQKGLTVDREVDVSVFFRGHNVGDFRADLIVNSVLLLELKTAERIIPAHESQVLNYLRSTALEIELILNFGPRPQVPSAVGQFSQTRQSAIYRRNNLNFFRSVSSVKISGENI
jgi:GxxExxY protein